MEERSQAKRKAVDRSFHKTHWWNSRIENGRRERPKPRAERERGTSQSCVTGIPQLNSFGLMCVSSLQALLRCCVCLGQVANERSLISEEVDHCISSFPIVDFVETFHCHFIELRHFTVVQSESFRLVTHHIKKFVDSSCCLRITSWPYNLSKSLISC
jgi:hypothetical protein